MDQVRPARVARTVPAPSLTPPLEIETGPRPSVGVIWLHGLGADGHDFEPIVSELGLPPDVPIRFIFPHAPHRPVTINGGYVMRAWYDIRTGDFGRMEDEAGIRESERTVRDLIDREVSRGIPPHRIVLAGFSQGGAIALHTGLRAPAALGGIIALSTYLPLIDTLGLEAHAANRAIPIFMAHGTHDPVIPLDRGRASAERLTAHGAAVLWRTYPMEHSVHPAEIGELAAWITKVLATHR